MFRLRLLEALGRVYAHIPRSENYKIRITFSFRHLLVTAVYIQSMGDSRAGEETLGAAEVVCRVQVENSVEENMMLR